MSQEPDILFYLALNLALWFAILKVRHKSRYLGDLELITFIPLKLWADLEVNGQMLNLVKSLFVTLTLTAPGVDGFKNNFAINVNIERTKCRTEESYLYLKGVVRLRDQRSSLVKVMFFQTLTLP